MDNRAAHRTSLCTAAYAVPRLTTLGPDALRPTGFGCLNEIENLEPIPLTNEIALQACKKTPPRRQDASGKGVTRLAIWNRSKGDLEGSLQIASKPHRASNSDKF